MVRSLGLMVDLSSHEMNHMLYLMSLILDFYTSNSVSCCIKSLALRSYALLFLWGFMSIWSHQLVLYIRLSLINVVQMNEKLGPLLYLINTNIYDPSMLMIH